ncbi:retropepsin-like aspartic protease family protein [Faunimonas sp. B44]|uniref:retropepsin-like aspartic protease family protein n=1 Tax=Faunimonas sp. B44 TaxID=3461493 RepID=UPI004044CD34
MRPLVITSILIALVAASAPSVIERFLPGRTLDGTARPTAVPGGIARTAPAEADTARRVTVRAEPDGHFYIDGHINFRPVRLMVDTGASVIALRESDAAAVGLRMRRSDFRQPVQTANGTTNAAEAILNEVAVRDIAIGNVRALVIPDDRLAVSLLGASFLNRLRRFEVANGVLVFEN